MVIVAKDTDFTYLKGKSDWHKPWTLLMVLFGTLALFTIPALGIFLFVLALCPWISMNSYQKGIQGEKRVAEALQGLSDQYYLLNDVSLTQKGGNLDHVVLGPNGIFVIETKNYSGRISCYGDNWYRAWKREHKRGPKISSVSKQVKVNAKRLHNFLAKHVGEIFLDSFVIPIITFTNPSLDLTLKNPTVDVTGLGKLTSVIETSGRENHFSDLELLTLVQVINDNSYLDKGW